MWLGGVLGLRPPKQLFSAVLLDPPAELEARRADKGGHVVLRWLPPPGAPMASLIRYEVNISAGSAAGGAQRVRQAPTTQPQRPNPLSPPQTVTTAPPPWPRPSRSRP